MARAAPHAVGASAPAPRIRLMGLLEEVGAWLTDSAQWSGPAGIPARTLEHVEVSLAATLLGALVAIPMAVYVGHARKGEFAAVSAANIGRALPSFGVLALVFPFTFDLPGELGFWATLIALFLLSIPPVFTNTYIGVRDVDAPLVEAARGMGMSGRHVLVKVEIPLAIPLIVAGLRTAAVQVVATATLAAFVGWGGLGRFIVDGFAAGDDPQKAGGAVLVAALALVTELAFGSIERAVTPRGVAQLARRRMFFDRVRPEPRVSDLSS